jgi:hypothetical protein
MIFIILSGYAGYVYIPSDSFPPVCVHSASFVLFPSPIDAHSVLIHSDPSPLVVFTLSSCILISLCPSCVHFVLICSDPTLLYSCDHFLLVCSDFSHRLGSLFP